HSGHAWLSGAPDGDPHMPPLAYGDVVAPMFLTVAILAALEHRARTGEGQHLDVSQIEPMVHVIADLYAQTPTEKMGNADPTFIVHGVYPTAGEGEWIAITAETETEAVALKTALNIASLDDAVIGMATRQHDKFALFERLAA